LVMKFLRAIVFHLETFLEHAHVQLTAVLFVKKINFRVPLK